jgi:tripartite-type tricarboxylate transporter receptor subunit TctC
MHRAARCIGRWLLAAIVVPAAVAAGAADYPSRPIRLITGTAPGSALDIAARQIAKRLGPALGQPVLVEARATGGGVVALEMLKASQPDGYTLGLVHIPQMSAAPALFGGVPYDPLTDFSPVGIVFRAPQVLVSNPDVFVSTLAEMIRLSKSSQGLLKYSTPATGSASHLLMEQLKAATKADFLHVPYRGVAATVAVMKGEVELLLESTAPLNGYLQEGKLRALAVTGLQRLPALPDVPTFDELGIRGMDDVSVGVIAPARTPRPVIERLHAELERVMRQPNAGASWQALGRVVAVSSPEQMRAEIREETLRWSRVIREAGISTQ